MISLKCVVLKGLGSCVFPKVQIYASQVKKENTQKVRDVYYDQNPMLMPLRGIIQVFSCLNVRSYVLCFTFSFLPVNNS